MTPREYEEHAAELRREGWEVVLSPPGPDYGIDATAAKDGRLVAVQAKMYGSARPINREIVMELYGAAAYAGCQNAMIVTDAAVLLDARMVADKLGIVIRLMPAIADVPASTRGMNSGAVPTFDSVWQEHVMPLAGSTLRGRDGRSNSILAVDWGGVVRTTSTGHRQRIKIEIFEQVIGRLLDGESVSRDWINAHYVGRASSGIVLILSQVSLFSLSERPLALRLRDAT